MIIRCIIIEIQKDNFVKFEIITSRSIRSYQHEAVQWGCFRLFASGSAAISQMREYICHF